VEQIQHGGQDVGIGEQIGDAAALKFRKSVEKKGDAKFAVVEAASGAPERAFAEMDAVVGGEEGEGVAGSW